MKTKLDIGQIVYTVGKLEISCDPFKYKVYISEKRINKIVITSKETIYIAGANNECVFTYREGDTGDTIVIGNCVCKKSVYLKKRDALKKRNLIIATDPARYVLT